MENPFDDDRTRVHPGLSATSEAAPEASAATSDTPATFEPIGALSGINPLENAASKLLSILVTIKKAATHPSPNQLRGNISREVELFRENAGPLVSDPKQLTMASYVLCTALDEAALNTPWGHNSDWPQNSLLSTFHGEVRGGERFFELLKRLGSEPGKNINLLELMYVILSLGYEGTYKITKDGQQTLVKVRNWLYEIIRSERGGNPQVLSSRWQGSNVIDNKLPGTTPIWVMLAAAIGVCALLYFTLLTRLSDNATNTIATFLPLKAQALSLSDVTPPVRAPQTAEPQTDTNTQSATPDTPALPTLTQLLTGQINQGLLTVEENYDHAKVQLNGDNLFASGKASIDSSAQPLIAELAQAINTYAGSVLITGHTDNIPMRKANFPSNLDLSQARAESVLTMLSEGVADDGRLIAEGVGELQPITDNSTKALRAKNRRVEITVFY